MKLKNLIPIAALAFLVSCGPTYELSDGTVVVSDDTRTAFVTQYPNASTVKWSYYDPDVTPIVDWELVDWPVLDDRDYIVTFSMDNEPYYAGYDSEGNWVGTAYVVSNTTTIPVSVNKVVTDS